jgi:integrase
VPDPAAAAANELKTLVQQLVPADDVAGRLLSRVTDFIALADGAFSAATLAALRSDGRLFSRWCRDRNLSWLPADPETIVAFVLDEGGRKKPTTVARYLASIAMWHRAADLPNPCGTLRVQMARRRIAREWALRAPQTVKQAPALGGREVAEIVTAIGERAGERVVDVRDRALILTARDSLARASELVALRWDEIEPGDDGSGTVLIRRGKTDQEGAGRVAWLSPETMQALAAWQAALVGHLAAVRERCEADVAKWEKANQRFYRSQRRIESLWRSLDAARARLAALPSPPGERIFWQLDGSPSDRLSREAVSRIFKARGVEAFGRDDYSAHSTRVGAAQDLIEAGADLAGAMNAGGWKSPAMVARYAARLLAQRNAVAQLRRGRTGTGESSD